MQSMTTDTSSRSSTSASKRQIRRIARRAPSPSSARDRPAQSGWLAANEMRMPAQPGSAATFSQPEIPRSISATTRSRTSWSPSAATHSSTPRPRRLGGRIVASVVAAAVYGYWSAATSRPSARAASSTATASAARPHTARAPHLRCETWRRAPAAPASRAARIVGDRLGERGEQPGAPRCACASRTARRAARPP